MSEAQLSENADHKVQRYCKNDIDTERDHQSFHQTGNTSRADQSLHNDKCCDNDPVCDQIVFCILIHFLQHIPHLHFLLNLFSKQSGRLHEKHDDQHCKHKCVCHLRGDVCSSKDLDDAE